ncbi:chaperone, ATP12 [Roseococcus sp. SYP-B2431]|uniref:ATP12 family chaperone protein n=1 Tax=Roseococcus sp. SYP-B2431 TaxID=2496640 RepID=UPI0010403B49|nr:ATP12 family protein [Roseococcus sp. SYP-B2431]TCH98544.1 chaperone, ATP12 [Roseococcus sp. SYP-B2431]
MKRFWDHAACVQEDGGFAIHLDGRPMRLPGGGTLRVATRELGEALAGEWQAAGGAKDGEMSWEDVPLTRLAGTAAERIAPAPEATIEAIAKYAETDLLSYRAEDPDLAVLQRAAWDPWIQWAARELGAELRSTTGIMPIRQSPATIDALHRAVAALSPVRLSALGVLVPALGSLVLGLAVVRGALAPEEAHRIALTDELFQEERWGLDWATENQRVKVAADLALAARLASLA